MLADAGIDTADASPELLQQIISKEKIKLHQSRKQKRLL